MTHDTLAIREEAGSSGSVTILDALTRKIYRGPLKRSQNIRRHSQLRPVSSFAAHSSRAGHSMPNHRGGAKICPARPRAPLPHCTFNRGRPRPASGNSSAPLLISQSARGQRPIYRVESEIRVRHAIAISSFVLPPIGP